MTHLIQQLEAMERGVEVRPLPGGARLLIDRSGSPGFAALHVGLRMGTLYEPEGRAGLGNLLQNGILKGTAKRSASALATEMEALGAKIWTSSGKEIGQLSLLTTVEAFQRSLELLLEVLFTPSFPPEEVEKEKERVIEDIKRDRDHFLARAFDLFQEAFYGPHPFHKPVLGYEETVVRLTPEDLRAHYEEVYVPGNMVVAIVGDFAPDLAEALLAEALAGVGRSGGEPRRAPEEPPARRADRIERRGSEACWMVLGYPAPARDDPSYGAMQLLNSVLGGSMDSRLFIELRERKGLAYQVSSVYTALCGPSYFAGYVGTGPETYRIAREALQREIELLAEERVGADELERARNFLYGAYAIGSETGVARARRRARSEILGLGADFGVRYLQGLEGVGPEEVMALAQRHFTRPVVGAVLPAGREVGRTGEDVALASAHEGTSGVTRTERGSA